MAYTIQRSLDNLGFTEIDPRTQEPPLRVYALPHYEMKNLGGRMRKSLAGGYDLWVIDHHWTGWGARWYPANQFGYAKDIKEAEKLLLESLSDPKNRSALEVKLHENTYYP